ncbi:MAG: hypothetical protein HF300_06190 [Ignavibacteria bacterium]|jgi:hypothetical protein|nr:hypothetical protein [Ignavibacteria bacterium]MCU7498048.1 hypothetical protein [Ignavibacteria bacterium]MCU7512128.1 hypothetical protein [Ignavibacteria bacterium]MCU7520433.1 hypothetical protein [Ignavibacteria bacterium]MCU7523886.1 hypothetical protein [Ignavibacteria bacterium]
MIRKIFYLLVMLSGILPAQTITFDEFLTISKGSLNRDALLEMKNILPKNFAITALDYADFSGDGKNDLAIAVRPLNRHDRTIYVYMFCDSLKHYTLVHADTMKFVVLPIEIGFSISNRVCYITQKIEDKSWAITGYSFVKNELALVDYYRTQVKPLNKKTDIGLERYNNYRNLEAFTGYYDVNTLNEYKKTKYFYHPVYALKRNVYSGYDRSVAIDKSWLWDNSKPGLSPSWGNVTISQDETQKDDPEMVIDLTLNRNFLSGIDSLLLNELTICFDRSAERLIKGATRRGEKFRESADEDVARINVSFTASNPSQARIVTSIGSNYRLKRASEIRLSGKKSGDLTFRLRLPMEMLNIAPNMNEIGTFISLALKAKDGSDILLKDSDGDYDDPSSYARMVLLGEGEYYGNIQTNRFDLLLKKLSQNGIF